MNGYLGASAAELFRWTDPSLIPATTVTAAAQVIGPPSGASVTVLVPTDAGDQLVLLILPDAAATWIAIQDADQGSSPAVGLSGSS